VSDPEPRTGLARAVEGGPLTVRGLLAAIGGWLGVVESVLPPLLFVVLYQVAAIRAAPAAVPRPDLVPIAAVPLVCSGVLLAYRAVRRQRVGAAIAGAVVVAISAALVLITGDAGSNYVPGFVINAVYGLVFLVSLVVRRPLVGLAAGAIAPRIGVAAARGRLFVGLTFAWVALFAVRLAVELPLYAAHAIVALGVARILLGVPLYAVVLIVTVVGVQAAAVEPDADRPKER